MDFELTQEQKMWRETIHEFCAKEVKPRARAEMENVPTADAVRRVVDLVTAERARYR